MYMCHSNDGSYIGPSQEFAKDNVFIQMGSMQMADSLLPSMINKVDAYAFGS